MNQLDLLFDIAKQAARDVAKEIAKKATKEAHYDLDTAIIIAKKIYCSKIKREPTADEFNDLFEMIVTLCDEELKRQKKRKIQEYMKLVQNIWAKKH